MYERIATWRDPIAYRIARLVAAAYRARASGELAETAFDKLLQGTTLLTEQLAAPADKPVAWGLPSEIEEIGLGGRFGEALTCLTRSTDVYHDQIAGWVDRADADEHGYSIKGPERDWQAGLVEFDARLDELPKR